MSRSRSRTTPTPSSGPSARRQQVRAQQAAQAAAARRRTLVRQLVIVGAVAVVVVAMVATAVVVGRRSGEVAVPAPSASTVTVEGTAVPFAVEGSAVRLGPADAAARIDLWVDYSCPHCAEYEAANAATLSRLVSGGGVSVSYHNIQIVTDYGTAAGSAAACVAAADPERWPAFNTALYANHSASTDGWSAVDLREFAAAQGVTGSALDCIGDARYEGWVGANTDAAAAAGVTGTPTMFLNGEPLATPLAGQALVDEVNRRVAG